MNPAEHTDALAPLLAAASRPYGEVDPAQVAAWVDDVLAAGTTEPAAAALAWALRSQAHHRVSRPVPAAQAAGYARAALAQAPPDDAARDWVGMVLDGEEGRTMAMQGHPDQALPRFQAARDAATRLSAQHLRPIFCVYVGNAQTRLGAFEEALASYEEALATLTDEHAPGTWGLAQHNLAILYGELGDLPQAIDTCLRADEAYDGRRPAVLDTLALFLRDAQRFDEALDYARRGVTLAREGADPSAVARTLSTLGSVLLDAGAHQQAVAPYREALQQLQSVDYAHGEMAARAGLATVHLASGDGQAALEVLEPLFEPSRQQVDARWQVRIARLRARALRATGQLEQAFDLLEDAHRMESERVRREAADRLQHLRVRHEVGRAQRVAARMARARMHAEKKVEQHSLRLHASIHAAAEARVARDELEAQLLAAQRLQAVGLLAGGIAHDFNNLLTVTLGYLELLDCDATPEQRGLIEHARDASDRSASLARQLLALSRGKAQVRAHVGIDAFIAELAGMLGGVLDRRITLATEPGAPSIDLFVDPSQLEQVLLNLILNARDAIDGAGTITVGSDISERPAPWGWDLRYLRLHVRDTGMGMPAALLARVTEPLFTTKGPGQGTGLGLSTVATLVGRMGGTLELQSTVGQGTLASVELPLAPLVDDGPATGIDARIIVYSAAPLVRGVVVSLLADAGLHALGADDDGEARMHLAQGSIALIVTIDDGDRPLNIDPSSHTPHVLRLPPLGSLSPSSVVERTLAALATS